MPIVTGDSYTIDAAVKHTRSKAISEGLRGFAEQNVRDRNATHKLDMDSIEASQKVKLASLGSQAKIYIDQEAEKNGKGNYESWQETEGFQKVLSSFDGVPEQLAGYARGQFENLARESHAKFNSAHLENDASIEFGNGFGMIPPEDVNDYYDLAASAENMSPDILFKTALGALKNNSDLKGLATFDKRTDLTPEQHLAIKQSASIINNKAKAELSVAQELWVRENEDSPGYLDGLKEQGIYDTYSNSQKAAAIDKTNDNIAEAQAYTENLGVVAGGGNVNDLVVNGMKETKAKELYDGVYRKAPFDKKMEMLRRSRYNMTQTQKQDLLSGMSLVQPRDGATSADLNPKFKEAFAMTQLIVSEMGSLDAVKNAMGDAMFQDYQMLRAFVDGDQDIGDAVARLQQYHYDTESGIKRTAPQYWGPTKDGMVRDILDDYDGAGSNYGHLNGVLTTYAEAFMERGMSNGDIKKGLEEVADGLMKHEGIEMFNAGVYSDMISAVANPYSGKNYGLTTDEVHEKVLELLTEDLESNGLSSEGVKIHFNAGSPTRIVVSNEDRVIGVSTVQQVQQSLSENLITRKEVLATEAETKRSNKEANPIDDLKFNLSL